MLSYQDFHTVVRRIGGFLKRSRKIMSHQNPDTPKIMAGVANKTSVCDTTVTGLLLT